MFIDSGFDYLSFPSSQTFPSSQKNQKIPMKPDYFTKPEVKQIRLDSTYMKDILKKEVTITKDLFEKIHSVLQNRVE